jgi:hypothetical protein
MAEDDCRSKEITALEMRLAELDRERASVLTALEQLRNRWIKCDWTGGFGSLSTILDQCLYQAIRVIIAIPTTAKIICIQIASDTSTITR